MSRKDRIAITAAVVASLALQGYTAIEARRGAAAAERAADAASEAAWRLPATNANATM